MLSAVGAALASTVTETACVAVSPSGSAAVTVTVAAPVPAPTRLSSLPDTRAVTLVVSDDTAVYVRASLFASVK